MPSFFKKLIYGRDLSNPYGSPFHPGHISTGSPTSTSTGSPSSTKNNAHPTSLTLSTRLPSPDSHSPAASQPRPSSPSYLEEARRLAGRDPITGRPIHAGTASASRQRPHTSRSTSNPFRDPEHLHGSAAEDASFPLPTQEQSPAASAAQTASFRSDVLLRDQWRRREEMQAREQARRELGGYFAPPAPVVREFYGKG